MTFDLSMGPLNKALSYSDKSLNLFFVLFVFVSSKRFRLLRKVDRRPTTICVTGFPAIKLKEVLAQFAVSFQSAK